VIARPHLRRGRICQLRELDHQRPRVRLEYRAPRVQPTPRVVRWAIRGAIGALIIGAGLALVAIARSC
jgi:hypothetical protein